MGPFMALKGLTAKKTYNPTLPDVALNTVFSERGNHMQSPTQRNIRRRFPPLRNDAIIHVAVASSLTTYDDHHQNKISRLSQRTTV